MPEIELSIDRCGKCLFMDSDLKWCMRYKKRITLFDMEEKKPNWCWIKNVTIEMEE